MPPTSETLSLLPENELVRRVTRGDENAFLELYDRFSARVFGLALRMLREKMTAEEVTQDTFMKLWRKAGSYDPSLGTLTTWLLTIARRTALDRIRRESRRPFEIEPADPEAGLGPFAIDPATQSDDSRWRSFRFAIRDLPVEQAAVIELAFYYGLSHSDISEMKDIPLGTVKTRIRLGMEKLRLAWLGQTDSGGHTSENPAEDV